MKFEPGPYYTLNFNDKIQMGIPLKNIIGVYPRGIITPLPIKIKNILGLANLEGRIVPIQELPHLFENAQKLEYEEYIILVKSYIGNVGLLVPKEFNELIISKEQVEQGLNHYDEKNGKNILPLKVDGKTVILIDNNIPFAYGEINQQFELFLTQNDLEIKS